MEKIIVVRACLVSTSFYEALDVQHSRCDLRHTCVGIYGSELCLSCVQHLFACISKISNGQLRLSVFRLAPVTSRSHHSLTRLKRTSDHHAAYHHSSARHKRPKTPQFHSTPPTSPFPFYRDVMLLLPSKTTFHYTIIKQQHLGTAFLAPWVCRVPPPSRLLAVVWDLILIREVDGSFCRYFV